MTAKASHNSRSLVTAFHADVLQQFRDRVYMTQGFVFAPFLLPFVGYGVYSDHLVIALCAFAIAIIAFANAIMIRRGRGLVVRFRYYFGFIVLGIILGFAEMGPKMGYWCYPAAFAILFVADRREARILIGITLLAWGGAAIAFIPTNMAIRFLVTYFMTCLLGDLVLGLLYSMQRNLAGMAITDPLTGAYNRRHMVTVLAHAIEESRRGFGPVC
ncbi:MAG: hypothetical protein ABW076_13360 [Candidatus Thiodiazotropha sp.]